MADNVSEVTGESFGVTEMSTNDPAEIANYMDSKLAAKYLSISHRHFARLVARGMIPKKRLSPGCVRYRRVDIDQFMSKGC